MTAETTIDRLRNVLASISAMTRQDVLVGIPEGEPQEGAGITNAEIGSIHEYGTENDEGLERIPARPFLVPAVKKGVLDNVRILERAAAQGVDNPEAVTRGFNAMGLVLQAAVKKWIVNSTDFAPLAESTLARRRRAGYSGIKPLIRTGQLLNSITYVVRRR